MSAMIAHPPESDDILALCSAHLRPGSTLCFANSGEQQVHVCRQQTKTLQPPPLLRSPLP